MWNEERKHQYLQGKDGLSIGQNLKNAFEYAEQFEIRYNRDICEWTSSEIIGFYKWLGTPHIQSLVQLHNYLTDYANWCVNNGLVRDNQNHFIDVTSDMLCKCVDLTSLSGAIVTRAQVLHDIQMLNNFCDQFIVLGLFEGIPLKDGVMKDVKITDLDENILHLKNGVDLEVSQKLRQIMEFAAEEKTWNSYSTDRPREVNYFDDGTIIRFTTRKNGTLTISSPTVMIGTRLRKAASFMGWSANTSAKTMMESGRINMIKKLAIDYGVSPEEAITTPEIRLIHEKIYGKIQNQSTWLQTYGEALK